ncbi:GDP-mannose 4,6-dehydratase [Mucilaginibacter hurinus]|uniref:GDP-mannose 4,6-dehydratase n=2 Tax=Mucilaginibacter hurinus TaxID=2201324 RepID=A0A367GN95_9SPHI|nr:GDP-mannose 4,6-dehydratase [Mucilaginibacter hurinus]
MNKTALITGITGQDGAYLSQLLLRKGYKVVGLVRSYSHVNIWGLEYLGLQKDVEIVECDLSDLSQVMSIIAEYRPDEIYNLAAQSSVSLSFKQPIGTIHFNIVSVLNILEAIRMLNSACKFYQASSSEIFGEAMLPLTEGSYINPISPYSISKASAHWITKNYRESYGIFSCSGLLFNHESYLRSDNFFVKKVILQAIEISEGRADTLEVGNVDIKRDFGWAPRYVEAMYLMLQQDVPDDFVICSGQSVSLRSVIDYVFNYFNLSADRVVISEKLFRPTEIHDIYGDNIKAKTQLGWEYQLSFYDVLKILIEEELANKK